MIMSVNANLSGYRAVASNFKATGKVDAAGTSEDSVSPHEKATAWELAAEHAPRLDLHSVLEFDPARVADVYPRSDRDVPPGVRKVRPMHQRREAVMGSPPRRLQHQRRRARQASRSLVPETLKPSVHGSTLPDLQSWSGQREGTRSQVAF